MGKTVRWLEHAEEELLRRGIERRLVEAVLAAPEQIVPTNGGRFAYQSKVTRADGRLMLLRAIVEESAEELVVVTAYWTSKIDKYWRQP